MGYYKICVILFVVVKFIVMDEDWKKMKENNMVVDVKNDVGSKIGCSLCLEFVCYWYF